MEITPELLASALVPKAESTGNNQKQKNKHYENVPASKNVDDLSDEEVEANKAKLVEKSSNWAEKDRRSTNDRRKQVAKRGRWLESRESKDRRRNGKTISITI